MYLYKVQTKQTHLFVLNWENFTELNFELYKMYAGKWQWQSCRDNKPVKSFPFQLYSFPFVWPFHLSSRGRIEYIQ